MSGFKEAGSGTTEDVEPEGYVSRLHSYRTRLKGRSRK